MLAIEKGKHYYIHCKSLDEASLLYHYLERYSLVNYVDDRRPLECITEAMLREWWGITQEETCYHLYPNGAMAFGPVAEYRRKSYAEIIEFDDIELADSGRDFPDEFDDTDISGFLDGFMMEVQS